MFPVTIYVRNVILIILYINGFQTWKTTITDYIIVDHTIKGEQNEDINIKVKIWDSPGNERFSDLVLSAAKNTQGIRSKGGSLFLNTKSI